MEIHRTLQPSSPREEIPVPQKKKVHFASQPKVVHIDSIDRILKKKNTPEGYSFKKMIWKGLTILIGILVFPLGIYWLWKSRSQEDDSKDHLHHILKNLPGQIGPMNGIYSDEDYNLVWKDTENILLKGQYSCSPIQVISLKKKLQKAIKATKKTLLTASFTRCNGREDTRFEIMNADPISLCGNHLDEFHRTRPHQMDGKKYHPVLLHSLSMMTPSGYDKPTIEGELYRRTGLAFCLDRTLEAQKKSLFPLRSEAVIYSPKVPLFRHAKTHRYALYDQDQLISIISTPEDPNSLSRMIYNQLFTAYRNGHDAVIITPSLDKKATQVYQEILTTYFSGTFRKVIFAIQKENFPDGTLDHYANTLKSLSPKITR